MTTTRVSFPSDRCLGYLHCTDLVRLPGFHGRFKRNGELLDDVDNEGWQLLGPAEGSVTVADSSALLLEVHPQQTHDLSPLANLPSDFLTGLWLGNTNADDSQLQYLQGLTGLRWLDLQNNGNISDAGVLPLICCDQLEFFGAHWTRISAACLDMLAQLPRLTYVDIWGCDINKDAVERFRALRPDCQIRTE